MKPNSGVAESPKELNSYNNNNDSRYLHKKFKKMASVLHVDNDLRMNNLENYKLSSSAVHRSHNVVSNDISESESHVSGFSSPPRAATTTVPSLVSISYVTPTSTNGVNITGLSGGREYYVQTNVKENSHSSSGSGSGSEGRSEYLTSDSTAAISKALSGVLDLQLVCDNGKDPSGNAGNGKHVCPYCKLSCAKPSVLQKHIRAHTNERPYPCVPCGFAFKTKSNLYKHCRSRSHALRLQGSEETANVEDDCSLGSETDIPNGSSNKCDIIWNSDRVCTQSDYFENSTETESVSSPSHSHTNSEPKSKTIYKPKFHKAILYVDDEDSQRSAVSPSSEFFKLHISKIISENEAIIDARDARLHRKYLKDSSNNKISTETPSDTKNQLQPLNLTKNSDSTDASYRKRCYSESFALPDALASKASQHPLNPEGSIIKDLLLKARAQARGLLPVTSETYDGSETLYTCPSCQIPFRSAENLEIHSSYYCKSNSMTREHLKTLKADAGYTRSNSVHVTLPETYNPNTLAKLATSTLKAPLRANKPENLVIQKTDPNEISAPLPSPGPLLGNTRLVDTRRNVESSKVSSNLERTHKRKEEAQSRLAKISEENVPAEMFSSQSKMRNIETPTTLRSLEELSLSPLKQNSTSLQMFGGEVKILDNSGGTTTMRIEPLASQHSPTMISQSRASPKSQGPENIVVRSGLHSGGTIVHNPPTPKEPLPSPHPQTPRLLVSIAPNISTPNLTVTGIPAPNMTKFQFPPLGAITAYNPLTLPPLPSPPSSPGGPTTIMHGGKLIPYVPGMPGPNSLSSFLPVQTKISLNFVSTNSETKAEMSVKKDASKTIVFSPVESERISKKSNHRMAPSDKRETPMKYSSHAPPSPITKLPIPTIKVTPDLPSKAQKTDSKMLLPQHKIDEIVKRNSEILQKNDVARDTKTVSALTIKLPPNKLPDRGIVPNTAGEESAARLLKHSVKSLCSNSDSNQFNFENLISKSEIPNKSMETSRPEETLNLSKVTLINEPSAKISERSETSYFKKCVTSTTVAMADGQKPKFLRPTSLPLKPGTFTPKRHHGITPNANTLPLISPETPRPAKAYGQLYLNGHAYTYLGLKCSAKVYYCTLNRPQPTYVPNQHSLSMYSNWQVCSEATPHPLGLTPGKAMVHYDSRHRPQNYSVAKMKQDHLMTHSSQWSVIVSKQQESSGSSDRTSTSDQPCNKINSVTENPNTSKSSKNLSGGFESNEEYTYVRGRGRGRYVCSECGIRCKKPSMLKKHIRTHTDVRPFTCKHCAFSFKTKGNLTKHMKSKAHYKKCMELGISPVEEGDSGEGDSSTCGPAGDSDDDSDYEDDAETESSDTDSWKSRLEHEAAHCLLSLRVGQPAPGLLSSARPTTYPYAPNITEANSSADVRGEEPQTLENRFINKKLILMDSSTSKHEDVSRANACYPMDLSKPVNRKHDEQKNIQQQVWISNAEDILTPVGEPDLLASLVQSSAKLPQRFKEWHDDDDEPMLQAYLTEKALQDSKMKQSQYKKAQTRQTDFDREMSDSSKCVDTKESSVINFVIGPKAILNNSKDQSALQGRARPDHNATQPEYGSGDERMSSPGLEKISSAASESCASTENAKFVASEYLKAVSGKVGETASSETQINRQEKSVHEINMSTSQEDLSSSDKDSSDVQKIPPDHVGVVRKVVVEAGGVGFKVTPSNDFSNINQFGKGQIAEDGRSVCDVCNKTFSKHSQLRLHLNIHYMERPFRCSACAVSFRTRGHLQKHERSSSHHNKVSMTSTFGAATTTNPRPFKCSDCKIAFRIHGHLAKHLRSKMHVMRLECLGKLPFGTFAEIERAGVSLTDIDTTDCDNSLASLQLLAQKLHERDPSKWDAVTITPALLQPGHESSDEDEPSSPHSMGVLNECSALSSLATLEE